MKKEPSEQEIKQYKEFVKRGMWKYILTQGGKMGIIFTVLMFLMDSFIWNKVLGAGYYLFYLISFGFLMGLWGWYSIKKQIKGAEKIKSLG